MRGPLACTAILLAAAALPGQVTSSTDSTGRGSAWATISYISGPSIFVAAGTREGVQVGTRFEVFRGPVMIAELRAAFVSSSSTSATMIRSDSTVAVGDSVRFTPVVPPPSRMVATAAAAGGRPQPVRRGLPAVRGRIGVRYLVVQSGSGAVLRQPTFDLRLDGNRIGGSPFGIAVDVRTQRTSFALASGTAGASRAPTSLNRVYQAALRWNPSGGSTRIALGRQFANAVSSIGMYDGLGIDVVHPAWSFGLLAGTQPEVATYALSTSLQEYGVYVQRHNRPGARAPWSLTLGGVGSYDRGQINREFGFVRATYNGPVVSFYGTQELDINRGWKRDAEGRSVTLSSTFATMQLTLSPAFALNGRFDNRRNVRLYRDFLNPEVTFDDTFRQGVWGGASLRLMRAVRLTGDVRRSSGGPLGDAQSYTGTLSVTRVTPLHLGFHARSSRYVGVNSSGTIHSVTLEVEPIPALRVGVNGGIRRSDVPTAATPVTRLTWTGVDADLALGRSLYLMLSTYREAGAPDRSTQTYFSLSYRF